MANREHLDIFMQGEAAWNQWREQNRGINPDLGEASLGGMDLDRANLAKTNLRRADLTGAYLADANLFEADLREAVLQKANLLRANLSRASLVSANLSRATLHRAKLSGADLADTDLRETNLSRSDLVDTNFSGANLTGANLTEADLSGAKLLDARLEKAILYKAKLRKTDLRRAKIGEADMRFADLRQANLREANLFAANLREAYLAEADVRKAYLFGADLAGADLTPAALSEAALLPIRIYLSEADPSEIVQLSSTLISLAEEFGFEIDEDFGPKFGSWFQGWLVKLKGVASQEEVAERLRKLERAVEMAALHSPQAAADKMQLEGAAALVQALANTSSAVCQVGSILLVKATGINGKPQIFVRSLTQNEMIFVERNQHLLRDPDSLLKALPALTEPPGVAEERPDG